VLERRTLRMSPTTLNSAEAARFPEVPLQITPAAAYPAKAMVPAAMATKRALKRRIMDLSLSFLTDRGLLQPRPAL